MVDGILAIPLSGRVYPADRAAADLRLGSQFIAGPENRLAVVALSPYLDQQPGRHSPLVLYGPHGSGKSHLARGLAAWWRQRSRQSTVVCTSGAEFAQDYLAALEQSRLEAWRRDVRSAELFVLDDLGQLAEKRGAQQELIHTLDVLADRGAGVVLTARTLPTHWRSLAAGLRSRISGGLVVPLVHPSAATRRAIVTQLAGGGSLSPQALENLANGLSTSVPVLAAAVRELELEARRQGRPLDVKHVRALMSASRDAKMPSLQEIASQTARHFGFKLSELKSPRRMKSLVAARGVAMYLARKLTDKSYEQIGVYFGGRDHTTVIHSCDRTERLERKDRSTRTAIAELKRILLAA